MLDESPDGRDFGNARNGFKLIAQVPILNTAQLGETALVGAIDKNVFIDPPGTGRIRADDGMDIGRQSSFDLLHVLQHSRTRPVEIGPVFKNHEDVGIAKHRLRADGFDMRGGQKLRDNRIRHLILDKARRLPSPSRMNDDLHVRNIRQCVERYAAQ